MHCVLFLDFFENIFKFSTNLGVQNESTMKRGIFPHQSFETRFLILSRVQREQFYYKAVSHKSYVQLLFRMRTQFHQKLVSYKCMLFVDCLVVLREYFVS